MDNHRTTRQRSVILDELRKVTCHPTATTLYELVRRRLPSVSLGTVYRNLEVLVALGLAQKIEGQGQARYDGCAEAHLHVRCVKCGRVDDLPEVNAHPEGAATSSWNQRRHSAPLEEPSQDANDCGGYQILGCRVEYFGLCPRCRGEATHTTLEES
jgi:Fur family ferric uptake transcriptional regulator